MKHKTISLVLAFIYIMSWTTLTNAQRNPSDLNSLLLLNTLTNTKEANPNALQIKKYAPKTLYSDLNNPTVSIDPDSLPLSEIEAYFYTLDQTLTPPQISLRTPQQPAKDQTQLHQKNTLSNKINPASLITNSDLNNNNTQLNHNNEQLVKKLGQLIQENEFPISNHSKIEKGSKKIPKQSLKNNINPSSITSRNLKITRQFGYDVFLQKKEAPIDLTHLPIDSTYILGPGDSISITIWGNIEYKFETTLDQKGHIYLPKIGNIPLLGITLAKSEKIIKNEFSKHYIDFDISVSITSLKTIKVFILGDVKFPGAYDISSLSTIFTALFHAHGPTKQGSLRQIKLIRNKKLYKTIDLYDFLLNGNKNQDITLKSLDTIFVPPIGNVVKIDGAVKRANIFEIKPGENAVKLLTNFAGGFAIGAANHHIQINKDSTNNLLRFIDISTTTKEETLKKLASISLHNGDRIKVVPKTLIQKNNIQLQGELYYPGTYSYEEELTLTQLINKAGGTTPAAYLEQIEVLRQLPHNQKKIFFVNLKKTPQFKLQEWDKVTVPNYESLFGKQYVYIEGEIHHPGEYELLQNMSVYDLIRLAKPSPKASLSKIEVYRKNNANLETILVITEEDLYSKTLLLQPNDRVTIKVNGRLNKIKKITLKGEFKNPGIYIAKEGERLSSIIERAGGYTEDAFLKGALLTRKSTQKNESSGYQRILEKEKKRLILDHRRNKVINTDFEKIYFTSISFLEEKIAESQGRTVIKLTELNTLTNSLNDIPIEDGDILSIPETPETIQIIGGVQQPTALLYHPNKNHRYYIEQAGNYTEFAKKTPHYIIKPNGTIAMNSNTIEKGDIIYIPEKVKIYTNWLDTISKLTSVISSSLAAAALAISLSN